MHDDYFKIEALSASGAKSLLASPAQYRHERDNPRADTDDFRFGRLTHCLVLEPHRVDELCVVLPDEPDWSACKNKDGTPARRKAADSVKALLAPWQAACDGLRGTAGERYALTQDDWTATKGDAQPVADAILDCVNPETGWTLRALLREPTARVEHTILWDAATSVGGVDCVAKCKARLDAVITLPDGTVVAIDPKTTRAALTAADLSRTIATFGYHRQAAHYLDALAALGVCDAQWWFIFASKLAPFEACWVRLSQSALIAGANEMENAKAIYASCTQANVWPSAQTAGLLPVELDLPRWYRADD